MFRKLSGVSILAAALGLSGCGPSGPVMAHVTGTVTVDGKPLDEGMIYFTRVQEGSVDRVPIKDGQFEGMVEVGNRKVGVYRFKETKMMGITIPVNTLPSRFSTESTLTASVTENGTNEFAFEVLSE